MEKYIRIKKKKRIEMKSSIIEWGKNKLVPSINLCISDGDGVSFDPEPPGFSRSYVV